MRIDFLPNIQNLRTVVTNVGENAEVVFDGHLRRTNGKIGQEVKFSESMKLTKTREEFLLNHNNKQRFLQTLTSSLLKAVQADGDADVLIVKMALKRSENRTTALIGEDADLLIPLLLMQRVNTTFSSRPIRSKKSQAVGHSASQKQTWTWHVNISC